MTDSASAAPARVGLLPDGLRDTLDPGAAHGAALAEALMTAFGGWGYRRVAPPLVEFEDELMNGTGAAMAARSFRMMDPVSHRMLAVRADITPQIARIAATRLVHAPRPVRLCYVGDVLRVSGSQLRPERQFQQAGAELIGSPHPAADAELVLMAVTALADLGLKGVSVDLTLPTLVATVAAARGLDEAGLGRLRPALDRKDGAAVAAMGPDMAVFGDLLAAAGPAERGLAVLRGLDLPAEAAAQIDDLAAVVARVHGDRPDLTLTIDPVEWRGYEYQTGLSFTLFAPRVRGELGRGGRYRAGAEPATGVTLYLDTLTRALPQPAAPKRLFLPAGTPADQARQCRAAGWATVADLDGASDVEAEARRLGCTHVLAQDGPHPLPPES